MNLKIVIIVHNLTNGGAERVATLWANGFSIKNEVTILISDDKSPITYRPNESVNIVSICSHKNNRLLRYYESIDLLRKTIYRIKPDLIIGVSTSRILWAKIFAIFKRIPVINTEHNSFERPICAKMTIGQRWKKFYQNKLYNLITVLTEADKKVIGNRLKNVEVLPNPCSFNPADFDIANNKKKIVLACGRLDVWHCKGFDILIEAWGLSKNSIDKEWKLLIAGSGSLNSINYLKGLVSKFNVEDSIEFVGYTPDIKLLYQEASVFVMSSRYEGFGMALLEAMSQGCACIACDYKNRQREIIGSADSGIIIEPEKAKELSRQLIKICNSTHLRKSLQQNAIERSKSFSIDKIMNRWYNIFDKYSIK